MIKEFFSLEEFRKLPYFKSLTPYIRKSLINIGKTFPETRFLINDNKDIWFKNEFICSNIREENYKIFTLEQYSSLTALLNKISTYNYCIGTYPNNDNLCKLTKFTIQKSNRTPEFLYHQCDIPPEIILKEGIKINFSLSYTKPFPPLVFIGTEPCWYGKYIYKIKTNKQLYIDTNIDWKRLDIRPHLCLNENITPEEIIECIIS
jgi:hypothetical protein